MTRLKSLREHFVSKDGGTNWTPKQVFESEEEVRAAGFYAGKYHAYVCSTCGKFHVHKKKGK